MARKTRKLIKTNTPQSGGVSTPQSFEAMVAVRGTYRIGHTLLNKENIKCYIDGAEVSNEIKVLMGKYSGISVVMTPVNFIVYTGKNSLLHDTMLTEGKLKIEVVE